jgi:hypothetical protein
MVYHVKIAIAISSHTKRLIKTGGGTIAIYSTWRASSGKGGGLAKDFIGQDTTFIYWG